MSPGLRRWLLDRGILLHVKWRRVYVLKLLTPIPMAILKSTVPSSATASGAGGPAMAVKMGRAAGKVEISRFVQGWVLFVSGTLLQLDFPLDCSAAVASSFYR